MTARWRVRKGARCAALAFVMTFASTAVRGADVAADAPAALLVYPYVTADQGNGVDTLIQLSNTADVPVTVRCFYENTTPLCTDGRAGETCFPVSTACSGTCVSQGTIREFTITLTGQQPLGWRASRGRDILPLGDIGQSGTPMAIPPAADTAFVGTLRCVAVDASSPSARNVLIGQATIERYQTTPTPSFDAASYNAIGIPGIAGAVNDDSQLFVGGPTAEYSGCPNIAVLHHFFDGALLTATAHADAAEVSTTLILVPCTRDLAQPSSVPGLVVQFLVTNEFAQNFTTALPLGTQYIGRLSAIDSPTPERSIFSAAIAGSLTGQTSIQGLPVGDTSGGGVLAVAIETHRDPNGSGRVSSAAAAVHAGGEKASADILTLPTPATVPPSPFPPTATATSTAVPSPTVRPTTMAVPTRTATAVASATLKATVAMDSDGCMMTSPQRESTPLALLLVPLSLLTRRRRIR